MRQPPRKSTKYKKWPLCTVQHSPARRNKGGGAGMRWWLPEGYWHALHLPFGPFLQNWHLRLPRLPQAARLFHRLRKAYQNRALPHPPMHLPMWKLWAISAKALRLPGSHGRTAHRNMLISPAEEKLRLPFRRATISGLRSTRGTHPLLNCQGWTIFTLEQMNSSQKGPSAEKTAFTTWWMPRAI